MPDPTNSTPNTVFRNSNPLDFDFYNEANQQVLAASFDGFDGSSCHQVEPRSSGTATR